MGQVAVTLNGRVYRIACADGDEARLADLAADLSRRVDALVAEFGSGAHERLLVMAALMVTDDLFELRDAVRAAREGRGAQATTDGLQRDSA